MMAMLGLGSRNTNNGVFIDAELGVSEAATVRQISSRLRQPSEGSIPLGESTQTVRPPSEEVLVVQYVQTHGAHVV